MLNFLDPINIDNLTIFRDDQDPAKFYVLPDAPVVPLDSTGLPQFLFLMYIRDPSQATDPTNVSGGYLQFRTVLSLPDARRAALVTALTAQLVSDQAANRQPFGNPITSTTPELAPPLWTSGTVSLSTFQVAPSGLVLQATSQVPADLAGDLGASFTATLSQDGAGVFVAAFNAYHTGGHQLPMVITYNLAYAGRISASMHIDAKHSVIHDQVWQHASPWQLLADPFVRYVPLAISEPFHIDLLPSLRAQYGAVFPMIHPDDFGTAVNETINNNTITVQINEASTGDATADQATRASLLKLATDLLTGSLMPALTTGSQVPGATDQSQTSSNTSLLQLDENATPGDATFTLDLTDAMSVTMPATPSAPLQVLIANPTALESCFQAVRLADDFFKEMKVQISTSGVDFSQTGITKVHVFWRYVQVDEADPLKPTIDREGDVELASASDVQTITFDTARAADGSHILAYEYALDVYWQSGGAPTHVPWTTADAQNLIITPPQLGAINVDAVMTAPPGSVDSATVALSYTAADHTTYTGSIALTPAAPRAGWLQPTSEVVAPSQPFTPPRYSYHTTYSYQGVQIAMPSQTTTDQTLEVPTPFAGSVTFTLVPQASAASVSSIVGTLSYADPAHGYRVVQPISLTPGTPPASVTVPVLPGGPRTATYTARTENQDGTFTDLPQGTLTEGVNFIGQAAVAPLTVQFHTDLINFTTDVRAIQATLRFTHADGTVTTAQPIFTTSAPLFTWTVPRAGADGSSYDADITFYGVDRTKDQTLHLTAQTSTNVELDRSMTGG